MKLNDWLIAGILNPEFSTKDFLVSGLTPDNTLLLTLEQYKNSSFIRDKFTENGAFNEKAFEDFYKNRVEEFGKLQSISINDTFTYSPFDTKAQNDSNKLLPNYSVDIVANPNRDINILGDIYSNNLSLRELALLSKIWDTEKGEWSKDTVNDRALFSNPIKWLSTVLSEPLVYATYDSEGEHYDPFTGLMVLHKKGEYKLNKYGLPYTETLNGRSLVNKEVVSGFDFLTVDGKGINLYDYFDSDGLNKSVTGTIMKSVTAIAPMLMGPYVAPIYSGILVGRELMKTFPMLYGLTTSWFNTPAENSTLNKLAGIGLSLTTGTSELGKSSLLNIEVLSDLITSVALQWGQQKAIATSINKLRGSKDLVEDAYKKAGVEYSISRAALLLLVDEGIITKEALERYVGDPTNWQQSAIGRSAILKYMKDVQPIVDKTRRLGADASLVYMALVSNTDVYQSMLESGATRKEAATVALGSTLGMFSVDRFLHLGELFFDDLTADYERLLRRTLNKEAKSWYDTTIKLTTQELSKSKLDKFRGLFKSGIDWGKKNTNKFIDDLKYHSTGFVGKSLGEGLEEVGEEFVSDISKGLYELASDFGFDTAVNNVGAFENWKERYGMSFLGGTLGGGLFYGVNVYLNGNFHIDQTQDELIYLVRNGKTNDILKTLDKWRDLGKFGSTSLSINTTKDSKGNNVFLTASNRADSLNDFIYNRIKETVLQLQNIIDNNDANLSDDLLYDKMILSEARFLDLLKYLLGLSYTTSYQLDYLRVLNNVVNLEAALKRANLTTTGLPYQSEEEYSKNIATDQLLRNMSEHDKLIRELNIKKIENSLNNAKVELLKFLSGEYSIEYTEKMLFALDDELNKEFVTMTYELWLEKTHDGKTPEELSPEEAILYKEEYITYKLSEQKKDLTRLFELYKLIKAKVDPIILNISKNLDKFILFNKEMLVLSESNVFNTSPYNFDSVLDVYGETEESDSYINRNNPENRIARELQVKQANQIYAELLKNQILEIIDKAGGYIDPLSRRKFKLLLLRRNKDLLKSLQEELRNKLILNNSTVNDSGLIVERGTLSELDKSILLLLDSIDLDNLSKPNNVWELIKSLIELSFIEPIKKRNELYGSLRGYINDAYTGIGANYNPDEVELTGKALYEMILYLLADKGLTIDQIFDLNNTDLYPNNEALYGLNRAQLAAFINDIRLKYEAEIDSENPTPGALSESTDYVTVELRDILKNDPDVLKELSYYNNIFQSYINSIKEDPLITLNLELDKRISDINPVTDLVKNLGLHLNTNMSNLEKILSNIDKRYELAEDIHDLTLTSEEKESFEEAALLIRLVLSYLYAASSTPNLLNPFGHNASINEFALNHKDIYKNFLDLPVLSLLVYNAYDYELSSYLLLMGVKDPKTKLYNVGSWMYLSNSNEINKASQFVKAERAWNKACYDTFINHPEAFKFEYNGTSYNLLEGSESIPSVDLNTTDSLVYLNLLFNLFYNNVDKLIKQGWTYKLFWERSMILDKLLKLNSVPQLKTVSLDLNVTEGNMTYYDKAVLLSTVIAINSTKFYSYLKDRILEENGIVPLTILEWNSRVGIAEIENPEVFNSMLEYIKEKTKCPLPILPNTIYIPGNAGSGKSRVIARNIAKYKKTNNIWISAPKESLVITLFDSVSKGIKMLNRESSDNDEYSVLFLLLGIDYKIYKETMDIITNEDVLINISNGKFPESSNFTIKETDEAFVIEINPDKFGIKLIKNAPDMIIIDEATHLSNLELLILSLFAKVNNSRLILLGDNKLMGWNGLGKNIDRELCLAVRAPNLGISLRDDNVLHLFNLRTLEDLINNLSNLDSDDPSYKLLMSTIRALLPNIQFKVYNQDEINGELILTLLTLSEIGKLQGTIGYVGRLPSATLDLLKKSDLDVTVLPEVDILGLEFTYVVIDKDFHIPSKDSSDFLVLLFLRDLYTMISRGRKGSIIIDPTGKLLEAIGKNKVEFVKAIAPRITEYADKFRLEKLDILDKVLGSNLSNTLDNNESTNTQELQEDSKELNKLIIPEIILDKDFDVNSLDFNNNYYVVWLILSSQSGNILLVGITDAKNLEKNVLFANKDIINLIITTLREGKGYDGSDSIVLMQFPKDIFGSGINDISTIISKIELIDNVDNIIPTKYIKNIIRTVPIEMRELIKTDPLDVILPPTLSESDIKELAIDEDDLPASSEDISSDFPDNPILCFGLATFTGMKIEIRNKKLVWINPSLTEYSDMDSIQTSEMLSILLSAVRNTLGKLMAPNGKVSNLSELLWAYVRTKAFKDWFGDWENNPLDSSKMLDENGEPKVFYHGNPTSDRISRFDLSKIGSSHLERSIKGFWFTPNRDYAYYLYSRNVIGDDNGEVIPVFLNIRNIHKDTLEGIRKVVIQDDLGRNIGESWTANESIDDVINRAVSLSSENTDGYELTFINSDGGSDTIDYTSPLQSFIAISPDLIKIARDFQSVPELVKRDIQIFTNKTEIVDDLELIDLSHKIKALKNAILYRRDYNSLPDYITKLISKDLFDNIKWYIEVRKPGDLDNFIRNIRFKEDLLEISSRNLMFSVIGELLLNDGSKALITLGLLSNPKNWINLIGREGGIRDRIKKKIEKLESRLNGKTVLLQAQRDNILKKIDKYKRLLLNLDINNPLSEPRQYDTYIEKLANMYDGVHPVIIPITLLIRPGLTDLHKLLKPVRLSRISSALVKSAEDRLNLLIANLDKVKGNSIIRIRIEQEIALTRLKLERFKNMKDVSFRSLNPYTVVSPMYIYTPSSAIRGTADIDDSVVGKCNVIFVTNEEGADPNTLVDKYIAQKKAIEALRLKDGVVDLKSSEIVPSVRMVVLNNLGISFLDMSNPYLAEAMLGEISYETEEGMRVAHKLIYPFKTNYMGVRMYVGLWNFRANLLNFRDKFNTFVNTLPINPKLLDDYLRVKDLLWRRDNGKTLDDLDIDYLSKHLNLDKFDEVSKLVDEFNDSLSTLVKEFRLGSDLVNGAYVRYLTGDVSLLYNTTEKVSGIYINSATLEKYVNLAESLFSNVLDLIIICDYQKDRLLSAKEGVRNSFSGHIKTLANANGSLDIKEYDPNGKIIVKDTIHFGSSYGSNSVMNSFSHIPAVLSKVFKFTSIRQTHISGNNFDTKDKYSIRILGTTNLDGKEVKIDKVIPYWNIWDHINMANGLDEYDILAIENYTWDNNLSNFFSFAFHGTLEDVQDSLALRATDAFAPKGFFADPLSTTETVYDGKNKMFTKAVQLLIFFGVDVTVGDPTFFITLGALKESIDNKERKSLVSLNDDTIKLCNDIIERVSVKYPKLEGSFREILEGINTIESSKRVNVVYNLIGDIIESEVTSNFNSLFDKAYNVTSITPDMLIKKIDNTLALTLLEVLNLYYANEYNEELSSITSINRDGNKLIIDIGEISLLLSKQLNGDISITRVSSPIIQSSIVVSEVNSLLNTLDTILKSSDKQHLLKNLDDYLSISSDLKQSQKLTIIKTLKGFTRTYGTKRDVFKLIRDVINKISEPNCI